jgi:DNA polymerase elongation subunit (family B)
MKLMTLKQYMKMTKPALIRKIMKTLRSMPKKNLAVACYNLTKSKLPQLKVIKQKQLTKKKSKQKGKKKRTAKQQRADKAGARRLKAWNKENR